MTNDKILARVRSLADIEAFIQRQCTKTPVHVFLDLDETVFERTTPPGCSVVATHQSLQRFTKHIHTMPAPQRARREVYNRLMQLVHTKRTVEYDTRERLQRLMGMSNVRIMGLTARYTSMAMRTCAELSTLSISMQADAPSWSDAPHSPAICSGGVIFTHANHKGPILERFLQQHVFTQQAAADSPIPLIVMVDDLVGNCHSVYDSLGGWVDAQRCKILVCHYTPRDEDVKQQPGGGSVVTAADSTQLLYERHFAYFLEHGNLCSDKQLPPKPDAQRCKSVAVPKISPWWVVASQAIEAVPVVFSAFAATFSQPLVCSQ